jgi:hypothetical protein
MQTCPESENLLPSDFELVDKDDTKENSPRKVLPAIRLRDASRGNRRGRHANRQRANTPSPLPIRKEVPELRRRFGTPPPQLPDIIRDLSLEYQMNILSRCPRPPATAKEARPERQYPEVAMHERLVDGCQL